MRFITGLFPAVLLGGGCGTTQPLTSGGYWSNDPCAFDYSDEPDFSFDEFSDGARSDKAVVFSRHRDFHG